MSAVNLEEFEKEVGGAESRPAHSGIAAEYLGSPDDTGAEKQSLLDRLDARLFSPANKPEEPIPTFYLADIGICTAGNLTAVSAPPKAGKTAIGGGMIAGTLAKSDCDCLGFKSVNPKGLALVHFDTEQSPFDHWRLIQCALHRTGRTTTPDWLHSYCVTGFAFDEIRQTIGLELDRAAQKFGGIHSFILDGAADCVACVNDPAESNEFVSELHALAIQYHCPIISMIHFNPGTEKTRGHLGSQLERKAETNLKLEKDGDGIIVVWADKNRRAPIPKKTAPHFVWSDEQQMHVSFAGTGDIKQVAVVEKTREQIHEAFRLADKQALYWTELIGALRRVPGINSQSTAERIFSKAKELGIIKSNLIKQWEMT